jgi:hypothetical protein
MSERFIGTHTKCGAAEQVNGYWHMCQRSYGHDDPKTRKTPTDHYDPDGDVTWPSKKPKKR